MKYWILILIVSLFGCQDIDQPTELATLVNMNEKAIPPCSEVVNCIGNSGGVHVSGVMDIQGGITVLHGTSTGPWASGIANKWDNTMFGFNAHQTTDGDLKILSTPDAMMFFIDDSQVLTFYRNGDKQRVSMGVPAFASDSLAHLVLNSGDLYRVGSDLRIK